MYANTHIHKEAECPFWYQFRMFISLFLFFFLYKGLYVWKFRLVCLALMVSNGNFVMFFLCVLDKRVLCGFSWEREVCYVRGMARGMPRMLVA